MKEYLAVALKPTTSQIVFIDKEGRVSAKARDGEALRMCYPQPYNMVYPEYDTTVPVGRLPLAAMMPSFRIDGMVTGKPEAFTASLGYADISTAPPVPTVALWTSIQNRAFVSYELVYGGPDIEVGSVPVSLQNKQTCLF